MISRGVARKWPSVSSSRAGEDDGNDEGFYLSSAFVRSHLSKSEMEKRGRWPKRYRSVSGLIELQRIEF